MENQTPPTAQPPAQARVYTQQELNNYTNYLNTFKAAQQTQNRNCQNPNSFSNNKRCNRQNPPYAMIGVGILLFIIIIKNNNI